MGCRLSSGGECSSLQHCDDCRSKGCRWPSDQPRESVGAPNGASLAAATSGRCSGWSNGQKRISRPCAGPGRSAMEDLVVRQVVVAPQPVSYDLSFVSVGRIDGCSRDWQNRLGGPCVLWTTKCWTIARSERARWPTPWHVVFCEKMLDSRMADGPGSARCPAIKEPYGGRRLGVHG